MTKQARAQQAAQARFRRFGSEGPVYEILDEDTPLLRVRVLETGEELNYPRSRADLDPAA